MLAEARQIADQSLNSQKGDIDPLLTDKALTIAASVGDSALYDKVMAVSKNSSDPGEKSDALRTLALFTDPALVTRTLDYAVSGEGSQSGQPGFHLDVAEQRQYA